MCPGTHVHDRASSSSGTHPCPHRSEREQNKMANRKLQAIDLDHETSRPMGLAWRHTKQTINWRGREQMDASAVVSGNQAKYATDCHIIILQVTWMLLLCHIHLAAFPGKRTCRRESMRVHEGLDVKGMLNCSTIKQSAFERGQ